MPQIFRKIGDVGHAPSQHDDVRIQDVDDRRQPASQPIHVPVIRRTRTRLPLGSPCHDFSGGQGLSGVGLMVTGKPRPI